MRQDYRTTVQETTAFDMYARWVWPIHRLFVKRLLTPRCVRCGISKKALPLDAHNVCSLCRAPAEESIYTRTPAQQEELDEQLARVLNDHVGRGSRGYDAVLMVSGGKDSALLLHRLRTEYPALRLLALTIDNSFMSPVARQNVLDVIQKFDVAHMQYRPNPDVYRKAFAYAFTHLSAKGCAEAVDTVDGELFVDFGRHIAAEFHIPLLIIGFSFEQVTRYLEWNSFTNRAHDLERRTRVGIFTPEELLPEDGDDVWWNPARYDAAHIPQLVCPFFVWQMHEMEIKRTLAELNILNEKRLSPLVTNNALIPLCGLVDAFHLGYSSWEPEFARMVREGKTDRRFWQHVFELMEYSGKTGRFISKSVDAVLEELNLTRADVGITHSHT